MKLPFVLRLIAACALVGAGSPAFAEAAPRTEDAVRALRELRSLDERVATVGHRLATAALDLCAEREWRYGFFLHDLSQYGEGYREGAALAFGLGPGPGVLALARGGPAERAGLRTDDVLLSADGRDLTAAGSARNSFTEAERMLDTLEAAFADGRAELQVLRGSERLIVPVAAERGCASRFQLVPSRERNARADGRYVQITSEIAGHAGNDDEMAAVLAHELAHNVLQHRRRLDEAKVDRSFFGNFGRSARLFRLTEDEADRLSVYLLARAGYDPAAATRFWKRFGPLGTGLFGDRRHGGWQRRVAAMEEEIAALAKAAAAGERPMPAFLAPGKGKKRDGPAE